MTVEKEIGPAVRSSAIDSWIASPNVSLPSELQGLSKLGALAGGTTPDIDGDAFTQAEPISPGIPFPPLYHGVEPRTFQFRPWTNVQRIPRGEMEHSFAMLRSLSKNQDVVSYCIRTKTDQLTQEDFRFVPTDPARHNDPEVRAACDEAMRFWEKPNRLENVDWHQWLTMALRDVFEIDAWSTFEHLDESGQVHSYRQIDGATVKPLLDNFGMTPRPPYPAFMQIDHGLVRGWYTQDELTYALHNPSIDSPYGMSMLEMAMTHVLLGIHRWTFDLAYYTEGTIPAVFFGLPENISDPAQAQGWIDLYNQKLAGDPTKRYTFIPLPPGAVPHEVKGFVWTKEMNEWIARVICAIFQVNPLPFISEANRATANVHQAIQYEAGLHNIQAFVSRWITKFERRRSGRMDIRHQFVSNKLAELSSDQANTLKTLVEAGLVKRSTISIRTLGQDPDPDIDAQPLGAYQTGLPLPSQIQSVAPGMGAEMDTATAPVTAPTSEITFNELTLAAERCRAMGDQEMLNALRAEMARRLGAKPLAPIAPPSDVEAQAAVVAEKLDPTAALVDVGKWARIAKRHGATSKKSVGFRSDEIPVSVANEIRKGLAACETAEEVDVLFRVAKARLDPEEPAVTPHLREMERKITSAAKRMLQARSKREVERAVRQYEAMMREENDGADT